MPLNEEGWEVPDPVPMEVPAGFKRPESLESMMRRFIRNEVSSAAAAQGHETFEEAMDFSTPDEEDRLGRETPWEVAADQAAEVEELREREAIAQQLASLKARNSTGDQPAAPPAGAGQPGPGQPGARGIEPPPSHSTQDLSSTVRTDSGVGSHGQPQASGAKPTL